MAPDASVAADITLMEEDGTQQNFGNPPPTISADSQLHQFLVFMLISPNGDTCDNLVIVPQLILSALAN